MKVSLTKGLDEKEAERIKLAFTNSKTIRERLIEILSDRSELDLLPSQYDSPSWPYLHADRIGYSRAIKEMIDLIKG